MPSNKSLPTQIVELYQLVVAYLKQETVGTLGPLLRFVLWGTAGTFLVGLGALFMSLGMLRGLQEIDTWDGNWSVLPYAFTALAVGIAFGGAVWMASKKGRVV